MPNDKPDQYDFFMKPGAAPAPKKPLLPTPSSTKARLLIVLGFIVLLTIGVLVGLSFLRRGNTEEKAKLVALAQQQNEIARVADVGVKQARNLEAQNLAQTIQLSMQSEQKDLQSALKGQGVKVTSASLDTAKKKRHDEQLTIAEQTNRFDEVFLEIMRTDLVAYQKSLKQAYDAATSKKFKDTLATQYKKAATLAGVQPEL